MPYIRRPPWEDYVGLTNQQRLENQRQQQIARLNAEQRIAEASFIGASPNKAVVLKEGTTLHYDSPDNLEWHGEFKRTRHEQENMESYNKKDLV